jgi:hypothetical protein
MSAAYAGAALAQECAKLAGTTSGRNNQLYASSFAMGQLADAGLDRQDAEERLFIAAQANGYVAKDGAAAARATIRSGFDAGVLQPRSIPNGAAATNKAAARPVLSTGVLILPRVTPGAKFVASSTDDPPKVRDEIPNRRHVYRRGGQPVRLKVKKQDGNYINLYRVRDPDTGAVGWQAKKPEGYVVAPYAGRMDPFAVPTSADLIFCPEGEKDVDTLVANGLPAFTFGGAGDVPEGCEQFVRDRAIVVLADNDEPGRRWADKISTLFAATAASVRVVHFPELPERSDVSDWFEGGGTVAALLERIAVASPQELASRAAPPAPFVSFVSEPDRGIPANSLPEPKPLPDGLLPVEPFDLEFLPGSIGPWVADIADRMQCPLDFIGIPATIALGSVIGRKIGIRPQRFTDWIEVPNLWGCIVGRPGTMKSPAMQQALAPLHHLEAEARNENEAAAHSYAVELEAYKLRKEDSAKKARNALKGGTDIGGLLDIAAPDEPKTKRYVANDATYESLGVILADNPYGVLAFRDELISLLKTLDREEFAAARGFFLSAWNGTGGYTFDRIVRGVTHIEAACLSLLGSTQPGRISEYIRRAISGAGGDDGLIQRFSLLVWPDECPDWKDVDRYPNSEAREGAWNTFSRLSALNPDDVGAERDTFEAIPFLRFDDAAHGLFAEWRSALERRLRSTELGSALESHVAKYRKLVPSLALISHLADGGSGPITEMPLLRAVAYAEYLETHARRAYAAGGQVPLAAAKAILTRLRKSDIPMPFTARDIHRRGWSGLTDIEQVQLGLDLLADLDWLLCERIATGGRPRFLYRLNPRANV